MTIPSLPTDNLYKFCAISGIVLLIFGFYQDIQLRKELNINSNLITEQIELLEYEQNNLEEDEKNDHIKIRSFCKKAGFN